MGYFIIVILILACIAESVQLAEQQPRYVTECWNQWQLVRNWGKTPSAWLTHVYLVEEICKSGVNVEEMDKCTRQHVDVNAEHILAYWYGIRDKYYRVCKHYSDYLRYKSCRTNRHVVDAYDDCPIEYHDNGCSDQQKRVNCIKESIKRYCAAEPAEFFTNLIDTELLPIFHYMECSIQDPWDGVEYVRVKEPTTLKTVTTLTTQRQEDDGQMEEIKEDDSTGAEVLELDVSDHSASTSIQRSILTTLLGLLVYVLL